MIRAIGSYLNRNNIVEGRISEPTPGNLHFIVVIPCMNEPGILKTLHSLHQSAQKEWPVEIIVVVNSSERSSAGVLSRNLKTILEIKQWCRTHCEDHFNTHIIHLHKIPDKRAGAGYARKAGMDEALFRFHTIRKPEGIIVSFDADATCRKNFFRSLHDHFNKQPETGGSSIYFEHPLEGKEFDQTVYHAICRYELHMRYYVQGIRNSGFPYAYHTVGSCFCVKAYVYAAHGGMNKRKSGEDFYFLHKIIPHTRFSEINTTTVHPSPRPSTRVIFGTGPAVHNILKSPDPCFYTYHWQSFSLLREFYQHKDRFYRSGTEQVNRSLGKLSPVTAKYLSSGSFFEEISEINRNSSAREHFNKRFFLRYNMLWILKFLNHLHREQFQRQAVEKAADMLLRESGFFPHPKPDCRDLLDYYRNIQGEGK